MDSLPAKKKKTAQKPAKQPLRDVFTAICKTDLKQDCVKEFRFHPVRKWRFDYALPDATKECANYEYDNGNQ